MSHIRFYISASSSAKEQAVIVCRLLVKVMQNQRKAFLYFDHLDQAGYYDHLLWTFKEDSFLPHSLNDPEDQLSPILLSTQAPSAEQTDLLIPIGLQPPAFFKQFQQVFEVVTQVPELLLASRSKFTFYKQQGMEPEVFRL